VRGIRGPFRSGKSSGCVVEIVRRALAQKPGIDGVRRTRWLVVRSTYRELADTTIRTTHMWLPPQHFGRHYSTDNRYVVKGFEGAEFEILFRALDKPDDISNLLSLEITGAWINEAREIPWAIVDAVQGRIEQYPTKAMGGCTWAGLFMDTNPPDQDSDWCRFFEEKKHPEWFAKQFVQPSGLSAAAENIPNLTNPNYYKLLAQGKKPEWVKVYIQGDYGFVVDGKPVYDEYSDTLHRREVNPVPGVSVIRSYDFGLCYDDQTEVLTAAGWKLFADVDEKSDLAATRNPSTGEFSYAPIAFKIAKPYKGEMLEWDSTELNLCVTPEHRVPFTHRETPNQVRWQSAEWLAQHMSGHHYVDLTSKWGRALPDGASFHGMEPMAFAEFMGLYLSEGTSDGKRIVVYQKDRKPGMQRIMDATGLPWAWRQCGKIFGWCLWDKQIGSFLKSLGVQKVRHMPEELRFLPSRHLRAFVEAYTMGDGHIRQRNNGAVEHTIFTSSERMAAEFQDIAQKVGWNSSVRVVKPQTSIMDGRSIMNGGGFSVTFKKRATRAELLKRNFQRIRYDGTVYCLNVPYHTLYVRRKGKPSWNGNTPACCFSQLLPDGRWLVFDEMTATSMGFDQFSDDVLEHCRRSFKGDVKFEDYADPAGAQRAQTDKRTCFDIAETKGIHMEPSVQDPVLRMESVRKPLRTLTGGEPQFILHPRCKTIRKGFLGGYNLRRIQVAGPERYASRPDKGPLSHIMNALEYAAAMLFAPALTGGAPREDDDWPSVEYGVSDQGRSEITGY